MNNNTYLAVGKLFFAVAILTIGIIHLVTGHFPSGLLFVDPKFPAASILAYINGVLLVIIGLLIFSKKYQYTGAYIASVIWFILLLIVHLPKLITTYNSPSEWTPTFEVAGIFAGSLILIGNSSVKTNSSRLILIGSYIFAVSIFVFAVLHLKYLDFIVTLIPAWLPFRLFWAYVVMVAFFAASISLFFRVLVRLSTSLLALMFFIWFCILHIPRVIASPHTETEWTSMFVVLIFSGIALLIAGSQPNNVKV
ncbi:hypothetical protein [Mucilaginibacter sp. L196]|uniref:hypothetical protein n=1 Tax=Mucilaginibacter sp. L196 TaxID=1641870 RepID=UPI00131D292C|nr:hypothetical protein [Mucilaginibacter sp. L196]